MHQNHNELSHQITSLHPIHPTHPNRHLPTHLRTLHQSKQTLRLSFLSRANGAWPWSIAQSNPITACKENKVIKTPKDFGLNPGFSNVSSSRELVVELVVTIGILVSPRLEGTNLHLANHPHLEWVNIMLIYKRNWQKSGHVSQVNWHSPDGWTGSSGSPLPAPIFLEVLEVMTNLAVCYILSPHKLAQGFETTCLTRSATCSCCVLMLTCQDSICLLRFAWL